MKFQELGLSEPILRAVGAAGYAAPTPIQAQAIPQAIAGRDLLGCAQTGTGKTAAFALPILHRLSDGQDASTRRGRGIRALVLSPTRELALQIGDNFHAYGRNTGLRYTTIVGGVNQNGQTRALRQGVDILIATPGRLLDLMNQGFIDLATIEVLVLDEADRMLDMGFIPDVRRIVSRLPRQRQTLFFSATMPDDIRRLADSMLQNPVRVQVAPVKETAELIEQSVYRVDRKFKPQLLAHLLGAWPITRALVFTRTKRGADRVVRQLSHANIRAEAIHGDKTQAARQRTLANFKSHRTPILVATDIAARGIDVEGISHVVNYDLPEVAETYVHRIGRTGRAGAQGVAVSFCDADEREYLADIERLIRQRLRIDDNHPEYTPVTPAQPGRNARPGAKRGGAAKRSPNGAAAKRPVAAQRGGQRPTGSKRGAGIQREAVASRAAGSASDPAPVGYLGAARSSAQTPSQRRRKKRPGKVFVGR